LGPARVENICPFPYREKGPLLLLNRKKKKGRKPPTDRKNTLTKSRERKLVTVGKENPVTNSLAGDPQKPPGDARETRRGGKKVALKTRDNSSG